MGWGWEKRLLWGFLVFGGLHGASTTKAATYVTIAIKGKSYNLPVEGLGKTTWSDKGGGSLILSIPAGLVDTAGKAIPAGTATTSKIWNGDVVRQEARPAATSTEGPAKQSPSATEAPSDSHKTAEGPAGLGPTDDESYRPFLYRRTVILEGQDGKFWVEGSDPVKELVYLRKVPTGKEAPGPQLLMSHDTFQQNSFVRPFEQASLVNQRLKSLEGVVFKPGTILSEVDHSGDYVRVRISGDPSRSLYKVPLRDYVRGNFTRPLSSSNVADQKILANQVARFKAVNPRAIQQEVKLDLGQAEEQDDDSVTDTPETVIPDGLIEEDREEDESDEPAPTLVKSGEHGGAPLRAGGKFGSFVGEKTSAATLRSARCQPRADYAPKQPAPWSTRQFFRPMLIKAANEFKIHPAILEASINIETDFKALSENEVEIKQFRDKLAANGKPSSYADAAKYAWDNSKDAWGKGLCQYGPSICQDERLKLGLDWRAPKPSNFHLPPRNAQERSAHAAYIEKYPTSVWNPEAAIMSKAKRFAAAMNRKFVVKGKNGKDLDISDQLMGRGLAETTRNLLSIFNRGDKVVGSYQSYIQANGYPPENYGSAWEHKPLNGQKINRRHIWYAAGLCGELDPDSLVARFNKEYRYSESSGQWESLK